MNTSAIRFMNGISGSHILNTSEQERGDRRGDRARLGRPLPEQAEQEDDHDARA